MSIKSSCTECKQKSVDGVLEHLATCSAVKPATYTLESRMPAIALKFDTPGEQVEWLHSLKGGSANASVSRELAKGTKSIDDILNRIFGQLEHYEMQVEGNHIDTEIAKNRAFDLIRQSQLEARIDEVQRLIGKKTTLGDNLDRLGELESLLKIKEELDGKD